MSVSETVSVGCFDRTVCLRVDGKGTFQNSVPVKDFIKQMVVRGYRDFVVDLANCELMDSTFMGTLAGAALRLRELGEGVLAVVNANPRNKDLLVGLGLDQLFDVHSDHGGREFLLEEANLVPAKAGSSGLDQKEAVLEAHEALATADAANASRFRDVIDFLRQEMERSNEDTRS
ncbi:MAG: hypothetical protein Fur0032_04570 [Terrimicrobiaceae bacterium]